MVSSFVKQVCHRDLKLENTLLDGSTAPRLKICDFGYSKVQYLLKQDTTCFTVAGLQFSATNMFTLFTCQIGGYALLVILVFVP